MDNAAVTTLPTVATLRRWLRQLDRPAELADAEAVELLRRHGRLPSGDSPAAIGSAAAALLGEVIEQLRPPETAPRHQQLPYLVLRTSFVDRTKRFTLGAQLGMSERQVTRERTRALHLLHAALVAPRPAGTVASGGEPIPRIGGFVARAGMSDQLEALVAEHRLVHVDGPRGVGKTSLVAEYATRVSTKSAVLWYQLRNGLNTTLGALLYDVVEALRDRLDPELTSAFASALTSGDMAMASRLALRVLRDQRLLLVLDDYHFVEGDPQLVGFVTELVTRTPNNAVVAISRHRERASASSGVLHVPPLSVDETAELLEHLRIDADPALVERVHSWTNGVPQLVTFAASWLKSAGKDEIRRAINPLMDLDDVQEFLLSNITEFIDVEDRHVLAAASVFRDRFTDDALAFVAERSRGQVLDTSRRLVRYYLATRAHDGEVAFFHESVREFIEARLTLEQRQNFHQRAAIWYERLQNGEEAAYHRAQSAEG